MSANLPENYEELPADFLREFGAQPGMLCKARNTSESYLPSCHPPGCEVPEYDITGSVYIAPAGTMAKARAAKIADCQECPHDELDHGICLSCGMDCDENSHSYRQVLVAGEFVTVPEIEQPTPPPSEPEAVGWVSPHMAATTKATLSKLTSEPEAGKEGRFFMEGDGLYFEEADSRRWVADVPVPWLAKRLGERLATPATPLAGQIMPPWNKQDALNILRWDNDSSFGNSDVEEMLSLLFHIEEVRSQKIESAQVFPETLAGQEGETVERIGYTMTYDPAKNDMVFGDLVKGETPRTDAEAWDSRDGKRTKVGDVVSVYFARALERDLAQTRKERDAAKATKEEIDAECDRIVTAKNKALHESETECGRRADIILERNKEITSLRAQLTESASKHQREVSSIMFDLTATMQDRSELREKLAEAEENLMGASNLLVAHEDTIRDLRARLATAESAIAGLRVALQPFADVFDGDPDFPKLSPDFGVRPAINAEHFARAITALASPEVAGAQGGGK